MADTDVDLTEVTRENLILHLADIRLPEPVGWWPVAIGWWLIAGGIFLAAVCWLCWRTGVFRSAVAYPFTDRLFEQLEADGDVAEYCHRMTRLLRETALTKGDKKTVATLHGRQWVNWMEESVGFAFSADVQYLLSDSCYSARPEKPDRSVHNELVNWLYRYNKLAAPAKAQKAAGSA